MATTSKKKQNVSATNQTRLSPGSPDRKRQIRLGFGIFFLLAGVFACFAIVSYYFTWQEDQDNMLTSGSLLDYIFQDGSPAANWGGRLGAVVSHLLVYRGVGLVSIVIGLWLMAIGLNLVFLKRALPIIRYLRWFSIVILIGAPILAYVMPQDAFPYGGAWGNEATSYLMGFMGKIGAGLALIAIACFFIFVIFALDVSPLFRSRRSKTPGEMPDVAEPEMATLPLNSADAAAKSTTQAPQSAEPTPNPIEQPAKKKPQPLTINDEYAMGAIPFDLTIKQNPQASAPPPPSPEPEPQKAEPPVMQKPVVVTEVKQREAPVEIPQVVMTETPAREEANGLPFEVIQQQPEPAVVQNAHRSIAETEPYAPELDLPSYKFPTLDLLEARNETITLNKEELEKNKNQIIQTLRSFGIEIMRISATVGPTVTLYEIVPAEGVRISKIRNLEDDIALNLAALGIRIIAPIPGKGTIGIEVPNANKQIVSMRGLLSSEKFANSKMSLPIALGKKIDNENYIVDLATMPHLLMAGATGQGKSVGINAILVSLLYKKHPSQLKFVLVDPKKVELSIYRLIEKHFLAKLPNEEEAIITDTKKVIYTLNALCIEMDNRYELLKEGGARNIKEYNEKFISRKLNPKNGHKYLPFIVLVVDEFADLIMTAGKEVEMPIARLAQLARAVGIHLIVATQRPSVNVITGTIKANFPARIAFKVSAKVDSRTILDAGGAEQLVGRGDMLVSHGSELLRLQCAFVDTPEVEKIVDFIGKQRGYPTAFELPEYEGDDEDGGKKIVDLTSRDKLFEECARVVVQTQSGSTSMLQRRFNLGYNRAGRIMDQLEAAGIVGAAMGSKPRDVLYHTESDLDQFLNSLS